MVVWMWHIQYLFIYTWHRLALVQPYLILTTWDSHESVFTRSVRHDLGTYNSSIWSRFRPRCHTSYWRVYIHVVSIFEAVTVLHGVESTGDAAMSQGSLILSRIAASEFCSTKCGRCGPKKPHFRKRFPELYVKTSIKPNRHVEVSLLGVS